MQLFVRTLGGRTIALESHAGDTVQTLKMQLMDRTGVSSNSTSLSFKSSYMESHMPISHYCSTAGLREGSTLSETAWLKGGKPVKVDIITNTDGKSVMIDVESGSSMLAVKQQLEQATGIPVQFQKVMLAGIGQMVLADKRSNIGFTHCGSTDNFYFATLGSGSSK